jgi:transposase
MITVKLSEDEGRRLEETFHTTPDRRLRDRCQAILMAARGRRHRQIAEDLGVTVRTLQRWLNAYQAEGFDGLPIQWASGRAPHIPESLASEILGWVIQGPAGYGLDRANWTDCRVGHPPLSHQRHCRQREHDADLLYEAWRAAVSPDVSRSQS